MTTTTPEIIVAMSGGVDSSVAAAVLQDQGYRVVGVTMKLWGGDSDSGCCSVADVDDARRVCDQLGVEHHVFNFGDDFDRHVVDPYVEAHAAGRTPNPCIECNRHLKFDRLMRRASALGIDMVATGHHARIVERTDGTRRVARGADPAKDQSYVVHMLDQPTLSRLRFPIGHLIKSEVRAIADRIGLRTAAKPESQDVCFITSEQGRERFLAERVELTPGRVVDSSGAVVGQVPAVELVTIGQRKGLGLAGGGEPRYALAVDPVEAVVVVGRRPDLLVDSQTLVDLSWVAEPVAGQVLVQSSAHGRPVPAEVAGDVVQFAEPHRRIASGQSIVIYEGDEVVGGGLVA